VLANEISLVGLGDAFRPAEDLPDAITLFLDPAARMITRKTLLGTPQHLVA
jgi:hypothetical protein